MRKIYLLVILMLLLDRGVLFAQNSSTKVMAVCCGDGGGGGGGGGCNIVAGSISISGATGDGCSGGNSTILTLQGAPELTPLKKRWVKGFPIKPPIESPNAKLKPTVSSFTKTGKEG